MRMLLAQWWTEAGKIPKYRIPKLWYSNRTEPNNTEPNLIVYENKGILLYLLFHLIFFKIFFLIVVFSGFFGFKNGYYFKKSSNFFKKTSKHLKKCLTIVRKIRFGISGSHRTEPNRIIPNRSFGIR